MEEKNGEWKKIFAVEQKSEHVEIEFSAPEHLKTFSLASDHVDFALEYYLLARYAYLHNMNSSFTVNCFWTVEHLMLSLLVFRHDEKEELREIGGYHQLASYWKVVKDLVSDASEIVEEMNKFDDYIGRVQGYFSQRYPKRRNKITLTHKGGIPKVSSGEEKKNLRFGKVVPIDLDELDKFFSFMFSEVAVSKGEVCRSNLGSRLLAHKNRDLYLEKNKYSLIYPDRKYSEM